MVDETHNDEQIEGLRSRIAVRGLFINIIGPLVLFGIGYGLRNAGISTDQSVLSSGTQTTVTYSLGGLALLDLIIGKLLLTSSLKPRQLREHGTGFSRFADRVVKITTISFTIGASAILYGLFLYLLGSTIETFVFFLLVNLVAFRLLRPGKDRLESLWAEVSRQE